MKNCPRCNNEMLPYNINILDDTALMVCDQCNLRGPEVPEQLKYDDDVKAAGEAWDTMCEAYVLAPIESKLHKLHQLIVELGKRLDHARIDI